MATFKRKVRVGIDETFQHKMNYEATFKALCLEFKKRLPECKLVYAYINPDPMDRLQMLLIFKFTAKSGTEDMTKYLIHIANLGSLLSLQGFDICRERGELDGWFEDLMTSPVVYPEKFLKDIINRSDDLTWYKDPKCPNKYWRDPDNAHKVIEQLDQYAASFYNSKPR